jgi:hypothetical protein
VVFFSGLKRAFLGKDEEGNWFVEYQPCPNCSQLVILVVCSNNVMSANGVFDYQEPGVTQKYFVRPKAIGREPLPPDVLQNLASDYNEAVVVLVDSPKASAALSRRCLQNILRDLAQVKPTDLWKEIDEAIASATLPGYLMDELDQVRVVGNFAAHPTKNATTGAIIDVEPGEAEFNLEVIEHLFDFYYVRLAKSATLKASINEKLVAAGKKPLP